MPKYMTISSSGIRIGTKTSGLRSAMSIASADAFYLVIGTNAFSAGIGAAGAAVASLLGLTPDQIGDAEAGVAATTLEDLPAEITGDPEWPMRQQRGPVIVIPRRAVRSVRYSFWKWGIFVQTDKTEFRIEPPFFGRKKVLQFLAEAGWGL